MMQVEMIEEMIVNKLVLSGMKDEGAEGRCRSLLYHLYTAVELFRLMVPAEKQIAREWHEIFAKDFRVNQFLKELKRKKNKEKKAPAPHRKEKNKKEKVQKTHTQEERVATDELTMRKKAFHEECHKFDAQYGRDVVDDFYVYWSEESKRDGKMLWEYQRTWNTSKRLYKWVRNPISDAKKAAAIKLARAEKKTAPQAVSIPNTEEQKAAAAEREAADAKREADIAKAKAESVTLEDYLKNNPNSILRTLKKND